MARTRTFLLGGSGSTGVSTSAGAGGTTNALAKFTGAYTIGDSSLSDNGTTITATEPINATGFATGTGAPASPNFIDSVHSLNSAVSWTITNSNNGNAAFAAMSLVANSGSGGFNMYGGSFVTSGAAVQDGFRIYSSSTASGGLTVGTLGTNALNLSTNNILRMILAGDGLSFNPVTDNSVILGSASLRYGGIFLGTTGIAHYKSVATAGWGVPSIYASARSVAQNAAVGSVATYTVGAADGTFRVSANVLVTTATTHAFTVTCAYTDEGNTARTLTMSFVNVAGAAIVTSVANASGAVPYMGIPVMIRCKAATSITIATTGVFTTVTYNVEGNIIQLA